jgi:hypothetical protein
MERRNVAILRHGAITNQRRASERRQIHVQLGMPGDTERPGHPTRRIDLARMDLPVPDREGKELAAITRRDRSRRV